MALMPGASRVQKFRGNRHKRAVTKIVLHTTEGSSWPGYGGGGSAPHFTVRPGAATKANIRQHIDTAYSAKALVNRSGGVETNNGGVIQIEFIGSCDRAYARKHGLFFTENADDGDLAGLAAVLAWIGKTHRIPLTAGGLSWPTTNAAYSSAPQRMSYREWNSYRGVCGHTHVPENDHWDPGAFPVARLLRLAGGTPVPVGGGGGTSKPAPVKDPARPWRTSPRVNGYSKAEVTAIQRELIAEGYPVGSYGADGSYGDDTGNAVKQLQADLGITADGIYGPTTEEEMATIKQIVTQNQKEIREARDHAKRAVDIATVNQRRIGTVSSRVGPITRNGKDVSLRQETADAKTLAIALRGELAGLERALKDSNSGEPIDLDQVRAAARDGVDSAMRSLTVTVSQDDEG